MSESRKITITVSEETLRAALAALHAIAVSAERPNNRRSALDAYAELYAAERR